MRTIGMDHARQSRTQQRGFRLALHEKVGLVLGALLWASTFLGAPAGPWTSTAGTWLLVLALVSVVVRFALSRRRGGQSGGEKRSTRSSSPDSSG